MEVTWILQGWGGRQETGWVGGGTYALAKRGGELKGQEPHPHILAHAELQAVLGLLTPLRGVTARPENYFPPSYK